MYTERMPAVVVPPTALMPTNQVSTPSTELQATSPYTTAEWQQHPHHESNLQEFYNAHGIVPANQESTGTRLDRIA